MSARFIESSLIKLGIEFFNGDEEVCGITTYGGSDSIIHAILAYKNRAKKLGITNPEM